MRAEAVILDFYGTLARNTETFDMAELVAAHGCSLPPDVSSAWWNGDQDGIEHLEHSRSAEHYRAWQRARLDGFLERVTGSRSTRSSIRAAIEAHRSERRLRAYPEVQATLRSFRELGLRVVVCSNWDWELDAALDEAGLTPLVDTVVSSAWAGARKPHPRIYEHTLRDAGTTAAAAVFVGDSWGPDV